MQCLCRWCVVCVNHQSGANGDRDAFSLWTRCSAHWSLQTRLYKLGELQACSHSFQPSLESPFVTWEKADYHFCSSLRPCCNEPFLCLDISLAISSFPQQTKQQHRLATIINFVQEARPECFSISWFSSNSGWRGHPLYLLLFQLQSFQGKYDTFHGTGYGFGDEVLGDQCSILVWCRLGQLLNPSEQKDLKKKSKTVARAICACGLLSSSCYDWLHLATFVNPPPRVHHKKVKLPCQPSHVSVW